MDQPKLKNFIEGIVNVLLVIGQDRARQSGKAAAVPGIGGTENPEQEVLFFGLATAFLGRFQPPLSGSHEQTIATREGNPSPAPQQVETVSPMSATWASDPPIHSDSRPIALRRVRRQTPTLSSFGALGWTE